MSRRWLRVSQASIDLAVLALAFITAFLIRFDGFPPAPMTGRLLLTGPYVILIEYLVMVACGIHRLSWRYVGIPEVQRIAAALSGATAILVVSRLVMGGLQDDVAYLRHGTVPFGVIATNFVLSLVGVISVRVIRRVFGETRERGRRQLAQGRSASRVILVGAGQAGVLVARELTSRPDLGFTAVGFLDDDPSKLGIVIHGTPVLGTTAQLPDICRRLSVDQVLITMTNLPGSTVRRVRQLCEEAGVTPKMVPGLYEIVGGQVNLSRLRDVAIDDLLRREPVELDLDELRGLIQGRVVMTTGAGGSIGSELCRQLCRFEPAEIVLVERSENSLFNIHRELIASHPDQRVTPCMADVTDAKRMEELMQRHRPAVVLHAAAHKHVPMMELNAGEAVKNNVLGTRTVADLADAFGVEAFVMISTDKAVRPSSVMGATKRAAEVYVQALGHRSRTRFVTVRFGNVLGSAGSVIPIFKEQIARGGPVTITHPDMRRYFMTIPEACQLVLQAGAMGQGGEICILDMGEPVRIVDLARDLIALSGHDADDVDIVFTGVRPGEKLFEELSTDSEQANKTRNPKIFVGRIEPRDWRDVTAAIAALSATLEAEGTDRDQVVRALKGLVPEFGTGTPASLIPEAREHIDSQVESPGLSEALAH